MLEQGMLIEMLCEVMSRSDALMLYEVMPLSNELTALYIILVTIFAAQHVPLY
jgi:hypothetical protein